jgi:hypothetical protein
MIMHNVFARLVLGLPTVMDMEALQHRYLVLHGQEDWQVQTTGA